MKLITINKENLKVGAKVANTKTNEIWNVINVGDKVIISEGVHAESKMKSYAVSTLIRNFKLLVEEVTPAEPIVEVVDPTPEVEPIVEPTTVEVKPAKVIKKGNGNKKLSDETYLEMVYKMLTGEFKTKKEAAIFYNVDPATVGDAFSTKYCRKSVYDKVQELKAEYNYVEKKRGTK